MKSIIRWTIKNKPAMNTVMIAVLLVGGVSLFKMHRETFPAFELEYIVIMVPYPGASPEEVEEGICQKIEEAVRSTEGIKKVVSVAREGAGTVLLELDAGGAKAQKILNTVRSDVDRIPSFPEMAEDPEIEQFLLRRPAIRVGIIGPETTNPHAERELRDITEKVRDELLQLPGITQVEMVGEKDYQIDIEISEDTLRKYGLTVQQVAQIVRRENIEMPGGSMKTDSQEILLRGKNKRLIGEEIAKIPLVTQSDGVMLTVGDLGKVRDEFIDTTSIHRINGRPGLAIAVQKTASEDLIQIVDEVKRFLLEAQGIPVEKAPAALAGTGPAPADHTPTGYRLPEGYSFTVWDDNTIMVNDRISLLARNGIQGLVLVLIVLAVFLELRLAAWVAIGIPFAILGGSAIMLGMDQTLNMLSLFAILMVLGILVDDAIVVGENVYTHRQSGKSPIEAAVDGTHEVLPSVLASVSTTVIAFVPLFLVPGVMGKFIAVMPMAVIAMLLMSLFESTFILPCHLAHEKSDHSRYERFRERAGRLKFLGPWTLASTAVWGGVTWILWLSTKDPIPQWINYEWFSQIHAMAFSMKLTTSFALLVFALLPHLIYWARPFFNLMGWIHDHFFDRINEVATRGLNFVIRRIYMPILRFSLSNPSITAATAMSILLLAIGLIKMDVVEFVFFPKLDGNVVSAAITYPDGTPASVTDAATQRMEEAIHKINKKYSKPEVPLVQLVHRSVGEPSTLGGIDPMQSGAGSHVGGVGVELVTSEFRDIPSEEIVNEWRELSGEFPGAEKVTFRTAGIGPGGSGIEFRLLARPDDMAKLEAAIEECKNKLKTYKGIKDVVDDSQPGKWEFQVNVKDEAKSMGLSAADLAETIRAAYYGEEVMRLQRGRHEVKLMVRYPREERCSLADFDNIRVRMQPSRAGVSRNLALTGSTLGGKTSAAVAERPLTELAEVQVKRGYSAISRFNQLRSIAVMADIDEKVTTAEKVVKDMKETFFPDLLKKYPMLRLNWDGHQKDTQESIQGLLLGLVLALVAMFALLTFEFRSYFQPILIMGIIPFGLIGAVFGHWVMGLEITFFSLLGLVALTGVVINDSIVLIDFMNHRIRAGIPLREALVDAGQRRFRPVLLTSLTTIVGLLPILTERSFQAQVIIPMATSLVFGLMFSTLLMLVLVPTMYLIYIRVVVGDEANLIESPELTKIGAEVPFIDMKQISGFSAADETEVSSSPAGSIVLEPENKSIPVDRDLLQNDSREEVDANPEEDANVEDDPETDANSNGNGQTDPESPRPPHQSWPPLSHLGGGQD